MSTRQRPRWLRGGSASLSRSSSWVQASPSACSYGLFLALKDDSRKARERELATFDENRRAKKERYVPGGRRVDTCEHGLSRGLLRVKRPAS